MTPNDRELAVPQHSDDIAVDKFASAMKEKLKDAREIKGRGGWEQCSTSDLGKMLLGHISKGDMRDVANFAMMLWHNLNGRPVLDMPDFATLTAQAVPKSTEIALWISERLKALPNEPCLASMQIAQYVTTELFPILTAQAEALRAESARLREEMRDLYKGYVRTLESARDRIMDFGGNCDPVDVMEAGDPVLIKARAALETGDP